MIVVVALALVHRFCVVAVVVVVVIVVVVVAVHGYRHGVCSWLL